MAARPSADRKQWTSVGDELEVIKLLIDQLIDCYFTWIVLIINVRSMSSWMIGFTQILVMVVKIVFSRGGLNKDC